MNLKLKNRLLDVGIGTFAVLVGAGVIYLGDKLTGVKLELFYGVSTFSPIWVASLFLVPFIAGIVVSLIYGLGGKMLAHLSPIIVRVSSYLELHGSAGLPDGGIILPIAYWLLVVVVAAEFAAFGGVVGEILVKKTYGRTAKHLLHKKYQKSLPVDNQQAVIPAVGGDVKGAGE